MKWRDVCVTLLVVAAALACVPAINVVGSVLAHAMGLPFGGTGRLAWDLGWLLLSAFVMVWLPARRAPLWPRVFGFGLASAGIAAVGWAAWNMGSEFPLWFVAGALVGVPVIAAVALGASRRSR